MTLTRYREKRDFAKTPEPGGQESPRAAVLRFVVQMHAARRLHYDFRLELDGVLKSWAVPKGPSLDPEDKRLAVHVEDHPIEYGGFEGVIPPRQYGAGAVVLWDRGVWLPQGDPQQGYRKGHLKFELRGEKLRGNWSLVRIHGRDERNDDGHDNWLLIKADDKAARPGHGSRLIEQAPQSVLSGKTVEDLDPAARHNLSRTGGSGRQARSALPDFIEPALATLVDAPPASGDWAYEVKFDGYRLISRIEHGEVKIFTRNGHDWSERFPHLVADLAKLKLDTAWLDGEACVLDEQGISRFGLLQRALAGQSRDEPVYLLFDLLFLDGRDLRMQEYRQRRQALQELLDGASALDHLRFSPHLTTEGSEAQRQACALGLEGLIGKRLDSRYLSGRSRAWIKLKCRQRQEFVIGGYTDPKGSRNGFGALLLGVHDAQGLRYAGRVGSGFDEARLNDLRTRLDALAVKSTPFRSLPKDASSRGVHWVKPELVAEVGFAEWTADGVVRQASFEGLREDKPAAQIAQENAMQLGHHTTAKAAQDKIEGVKITHPERLVFPEAGLTKRDVALYYQRAAPLLLRHLADRPISLLRCPVGPIGECFFQKHVTESDIPGITVAMIEDSDGTNPYIIANSAKALVGLAQMGTLELHAWGARHKDIEHPDTLVLDLDPDPDVDWRAVADAALLMRSLCDELGLRSFLKHTGGKGLHVVVPITPKQDWNRLKEFARAIAAHVAGTLPSHFTAKLAKAQRKGKIFIDYLRNGRGATAVAPYSLRARPQAPIAVPLAWERLAENLPPRLTLADVLSSDWPAHWQDPWADYFSVRQSVSNEMMHAVGMRS